MIDNSLILADNSFGSEEFQKCLKNNRISHRSSSPYYSQENGPTESRVKTAKLFKKKKSELTNINNQLHRLLFDYKASTHLLANILHYHYYHVEHRGHDLIKLKPNIRCTVNKKQTLLEKQISKRHRQFEIGKYHVMIRNYKGTKLIKVTVKKLLGNIILYILELHNYGRDI